jgi:CVNH domain
MAHLSCRIATSLAYVLFSGLATSAAIAQDRSSFQRSCSNISIAGSALVATCRRIDGSNNRASIVLEGIENIDGRLQLTGAGRPATFQNSCRSIHMDGDTLIATCRRIDGNDERTSVRILDISNIDGNLQY